MCYLSEMWDVDCALTVTLAANIKASTSWPFPARPPCWTRCLTKRRNKRRKSTDQALVFDVRCAVGPRAKTTTGFAVVVTNGIRSTREESVQRVFTTGLQLSVCRALAGRCIRIGMGGDSSAVRRLSSSPDPKIQRSVLYRNCEAPGSIPIVITTQFIPTELLTPAQFIASGPWRNWHTQLPQEQPLCGGSTPTGPTRIPLLFDNSRRVGRR